MRSLTILFMSFLLMTACQPKDVNSEAVEQPNKENIKENIKEPQEEPEKEVVLMACTKEAKQCPNGKVVGRNPTNNCEFDACESPKTKKLPVMCSTDVKECPDGSFVSRDHYNNCKFKDCPNSEN